MTRFFSVLCLALLFSFNVANAQNYSTHKVRQGETIEGIAKRYLLAPYEIYALNPDAKKELRVNSVLIIPKSKIAQPKVTIIKELQGYKKHRTGRKETLYSLGKKYQVEVDDIKKHNTFLYANPLRKGDKLQIPIFKTTEVIEEVATTKAYTIQPKEGKWRVAYKFGMTVRELEELNPDMGDVLKEGEIVQVPNIEGSLERVLDDTYSYYKVLPKEGFYRLKLKLGVEQSILESLNPTLKETGLKVGMILKTPFSEKLSNQEESSSVNLTDSIKDFKTKHIAVMLPFRLQRVSFDSISGVKIQIKKDPYLDASLDFYSGVLMAIDSLKQLGVSLKVDVYDTQYRNSEVMRIIKENNFEDVDAVIGPLTPKNFESVASGLRAFHTPVVSPIGENLNLYDNVFQSKPTNDLLWERAVNFVKSDTLVHNIIIISDSENLEVSNKLKQNFHQARVVQSRKDKEGVDQNYVLLDDIKDTLKEGKNVVFLETQNEGFVSNVSSILNSLIQEKNELLKKINIEIVLVTTNFNSAFKGDAVSNEHLSNLQFHYASTSKSYNTDENNTFVKKYEKAYYVSPNNRAIRGFDLTMDVVLRLVSSGDLYLSVNNAPLTEYVENKFAYQKKLFGGFYNNTIYLVKHQDLTIVEVE